MDSKDRRRQARLQGLHNTSLRNARFEQPKIQDEVDKAYSTSQTFSIENENRANIEESAPPETQMVSEFEVRNNCKPGRGRKNTQRYSSICSQRSDFQPSKKRGRNFNYGGRNGNRNVDETMKRLNGLKVSDAVDDQILREEKDSRSDGTKSYRPSNACQSSNRNFQEYTHKEQRCSPKSSSNSDRGRSNRCMRSGRPSVDGFVCVSDKATSERDFVVSSFSHKWKEQAESEQQYVNSNYQPNEMTAGPSNGKAINSSYKKNVRSISSFVYEETNQGENIIQKFKSPTMLDIIGWHKLIKCNPEDKESYLYFKPDFLGEEEKENYFQQLKDSIKWQEKEIIIRGERYMQPRLVAWYGPLPYSYSNTVLESNTVFPSMIMDIKQRIESILKKEQKNVTFNSVLLNLYRNGRDSVAWHSDDEPSMGIHPTIASVSLGETRRFEMKQKQDRKNMASPEASEEYVIYLTSGSLLVMDGAMQEYWLHRVPKEFHDRNARINLTFRIIYPKKVREQRS